MGVAGSSPATFTTHWPLAQWSEQSSYKRQMQVQLLHGLPILGRLVYYIGMDRRSFMQWLAAFFAAFTLDPLLGGRAIWGEAPKPALGSPVVVPEIRDLDVYLNGLLLRPGRVADDGDYQETNGNLKFHFKVQPADTIEIRYLEAPKA